MFDLETTGLPEFGKMGGFPNPLDIEKYKKARIIEIGFIIFDKDNKIKFEFSSLVQIPEETPLHSEIHGITLEMLQNKGRSIHHIFRVLYDNIITFNVQHLVAHNIRFDYNILLSELHRSLSFKSFSTRSQFNIVNSLLSIFPSLHHFCTMTHGRKLSQFNGRFPKLSALHQYLTGNTVIQNHRALDDVLLCFDCFKELQQLSIVV